MQNQMGWCWGWKGRRDATPQLDQPPNYSIQDELKVTPAILRRHRATMTTVRKAGMKRYPCGV